MKCASSRAVGALILFAVVSSCTTPETSNLPWGLISEQPKDHEIIASANGLIGSEGRTFDIHVVGAKHPPSALSNSARPMLIVARGADGTARLMARNDQIVARANEGGQCDPFEDGTLTKDDNSASFTVTNSVACGVQHWEESITFRLDSVSGKFLFNSWKFESWDFNPDIRPDAEALILSNRRIVEADDQNPVAFEKWDRPE